MDANRPGTVPIPPEIAANLTIRFGTNPLRFTTGRLASEAAQVISEIAGDGNPGCQTPPPQRHDDSRLARLINGEWDRTLGTLQG